jgi:hypothetical protein
MNEALAKELYENTQLTLEEIAKECETSYKVIWSRVAKWYTPEQRNARKRTNYRTSKLGDKNPMKGKTREQHQNYIGEISDGKGYVLVLKPAWFTGRKGCKHVFLHHVVVLESMGLTELPAGHEVHHIDHNPLNNALSNLRLMTREDHAALHAKERATTIPEGSTLK